MNICKKYSENKRRENAVLKQVEEELIKNPTAWALQGENKKEICYRGKHALIIMQKKGLFICVSYFNSWKIFGLPTKLRVMGLLKKAVCVNRKLEMSQ